MDAMKFLQVEPERDLERVRSFLAESDPHDYLLTDLPEWIREGRLWVGEQDGTWLAFGRLHLLGEGEGWISGIRVAASRRGHGLGGELLGALLADARAVGIHELRAVIENENFRSRRLFDRRGFRAVFEMSLRRGLARGGVGPTLRRVGPGAALDGPVDWLPGRTGRSDLLPGSDGGRFGRWRPGLVARWAAEGKLYATTGVAVAVQPDWWSHPRTLWANPLRGTVSELFPALGQLAHDLGQEEWQAFLPSTEGLRAEYESEGAVRHPEWGDRVLLYERVDDPQSASRRNSGKDPRAGSAQD